MKREILFRGESFKGEWVYGYLIQYESSTQIGVLRHPDVIDFVKVKPQTVGQFTGLTDKDGKRIFEGDVVTCNGINYELKLETAKAYELHQIGVDTTNGDGFFFLFNHNQKIGVIGSIHDNPELI